MSVAHRYIYKDRADAGEKLAAALACYNGAEGVALAVPRGGIPIACVVAKKLSLPIDLLLIKKIGHPGGATQLLLRFPMPSNLSDKDAYMLRFLPDERLNNI